ncbi:hypothetical protein R6Q57_008630, partial [Mikania cordata]
HPWIRDHKGVEVPIDIGVLKSLKAYTLSSPLRKAALRALSKTLTTDDLFYLKKQFIHLETSDRVTVDSIKTALTKHATNAMKECRIMDYLKWLTALELDQGDFYAGAVNVYRLEGLDRWEEQARSAYEIFESDGNRAIIIEELASELGLSPTVPLHVVVSEWIRHSDGKLSFLGFMKLLHGVSTRNHRKLRVFEPDFSEFLVHLRGRSELCLFPHVKNQVFQKSLKPKIKSIVPSNDVSKSDSNLVITQLVEN